MTPEDIYAKLCKIEEILTGNGRPHEGIIVRLDRLEQRSGWVRRLFFDIVPPCLVASSVWALVQVFERS